MKKYTLLEVLEMSRRLIKNKVSIKEIDDAINNISKKCEKNGK